MLENVVLVCVIVIAVRYLALFTTYFTFTTYFSNRKFQWLCFLWKRGPKVPYHWEYHFAIWLFLMILNKKYTELIFSSLLEYPYLKFPQGLLIKIEQRFLSLIRIYIRICKHSHKHYIIWSFARKNMIYSYLLFTFSVLRRRWGCHCAMDKN